LEKLRSELGAVTPAEAAEILQELEAGERAIAFRSLPKDQAADVFTHLSPAAEEALLRDLSEQETRRILADMAPDDRTELFEEMPDVVTRRLLRLLSPEDLKQAQQLLGYPEESVGRLMTPDLVAVRPKDTVLQALDAGTQSATLMVRALATGDVRMRDWLRMFSKEITIALALGLTMAVAVFGIGIWRGGFELAWIVSFTMIATVTFGSLVGMLLPFGLERFRLDPATASAPLITSIADIGGVLIYFSIATRMLGL